MRIVSEIGLPSACVGVPVRRPRVELTMNYYTDPVLLDVAGAMNSLPDLASGQGDSTTRAAKGA